MKDHATWSRVALATAVALMVAWVVLRWRGLIVVAVAGMVTWGGARYAQRRLRGLTGDIYGAICVLVELTTLLTLTASWGVLP
jgi:adenosylcobinamide-GDP ribazoletransferase